MPSINDNFPHSFPTCRLALLLMAVLALGSCASVDHSSAPVETETGTESEIDAGQSQEMPVADLLENILEDPESLLIEDSDGSPFDDTPEEIRYGNFSEDVLARVILAEMAGQRGRDREALQAYVELARETLDLGIIMRASRVATFLRDAEASTEMTRLWLDQEPDSAEAYQTLALQMLAMGSYREALEHLTALLELGHEVDFRMVPARTAVDRQAPAIIPVLIEDFEALMVDYPEHQSLRLGLAQLYQQNDQLEQAHELVYALALELGHPPEVIVLEVQLLGQMDMEEQALSRLREGVELNPDSRQLRFLLGRQLVSHEDFEGAREQFAAIVNENPNDHEIAYSLALINMEMNRLNDAERHFEALLRAGFRTDEVHYYLGYISNQNGNSEAAINHYQKVSAGSNFLQAQRELTVLLIRADRYQEARQRLQRLRYTTPDYNLPLLSMEASVLLEEDELNEASELLDSALVTFPDNLQLLYLRSVLSTERNDLELMEQDLRRMIELDPENPVAYNSLGYILADRTDRYQEAYELIRKAVELAPDDPAIIDSLGWVQYRLGMLEEARDNLDRAFELYPDHEVAAHLGEVLWVLGQRRAANRVWQDALEEQPDSEVIREAMQRLMSESDE